jgi:pSer/pThr/pTyr-binding forkhead associated (FHA) protein
VLGRREGPLSSVLGKYSSVSGHHAEIHYAAETGWTVTDKQSTNGTSYDGQALPSMQPVSLRDGGSLVLGKSVELYTRIETPQSPAEGQPATARVERPPAGTIRV